MRSFWGWVVASVLYAVFLSWYVNWTGPLSPQEVETYLTRIQAASPTAIAHNDLDVLRRFLSEDDGGEFYMLNLVRIADGDVPGPDGVKRPAREAMAQYTDMFLPALFARGGHPAIFARKAGGYFDAWGVEPDPGWTAMGYMRYRSRRDMVELVSDPRFGGAHDFKFAAMPQTYSFPTHPMLMTLATPVVWVALVLALLAALSQIVILLIARRA